MNHYEILEVARNATLAEITRAYRAKSRAAHPDKGGNEEGMKALNVAYGILSDPAQRETYDKEELKAPHEDNQEDHLNVERTELNREQQQILFDRVKQKNREDIINFFNTLQQDKSSVNTNNNNSNNVIFVPSENPSTSPHYFNLNFKDDLGFTPFDYASGGHLLIDSDGKKELLSKTRDPWIACLMIEYGYRLDQWEKTLVYSLVFNKVVLPEYINNPQRFKSVRQIIEKYGFYWPSGISGLLVKLQESGEIQASDYIFWEDSDGKTPLFCLIDSLINKPELSDEAERYFDVLLDSQAQVNINHQTKNGQTPLLYLMGYSASTSQRYRLLEKVLNKKFDPNLYNNDGENVLHLACKYDTNADQIDTFELLLKQGVDVNAKKRYGETALHVFLRNSNLGGESIAIFKLLLEKYNDIDCKDDYGFMLLHVIVERFDQSDPANQWVNLSNAKIILKILLENHADYTCDRHLPSPLSQAIGCRQLHLTQIFLWEAIKRKDLSSVCGIICSDSDIRYSRDEEGRNCLAYAKEIGTSSEVIEALEMYGVKAQISPPEQRHASTTAEKIQAFTEEYHLDMANRNYWAPKSYQRKYYSHAEFEIINIAPHTTASVPVVIAKAIQIIEQADLSEEAKAAQLKAIELQCFIAKHRLDDFEYWEKQVKGFGGGDKITVSVNEDKRNVFSKKINKTFVVPHGIAQAYNIINNKHNDDSAKIERFQCIETKSNARYRFFPPNWMRAETTKNCYTDMRHLGIFNR